LYDFFTGAWPLHQVLDMNFQGDVEGMLEFFVAESDFYPDLDALCRQRVLEAFPNEDENEAGGRRRSGPDPTRCRNVTGWPT
jgi:hypothetical protein